MPSSRQPIFAPNGAVATSQPLAAAAGLAVLRRGGNAVDAALATAITLTVVQPGSNDIGGDLFAIVWDGQRLHGLNGSGRSPAALTREVVLAATGGQGAEPAAGLGGAQAAGPAVPTRGWLSVTVPGAPAGWRDLHERFGTLPFAELFADAIGYAEHGFPVSPTVAASWARSVRIHTELIGEEYAQWRRVFTVDGVRAPRAGERWRNPDAAGTLRLIAGTGAAAFYTGEIAEVLAGHAARTGGPLTGADLAGHASTWVDPVRAGYRGHEVWELPPNGQGVAALLALNILDGVDLTALTPAERLHWQIEATKLGFADAHAYVADPDRVEVPTAELLTPEYAAARRAMVTSSAGTPEPGDPAKGEPVGPFGVMGGHMQPQGHVQVISSTLDAGLDPQAALDRPRWYWHAGRSVLVEPALLADGAGRDTVERLRSRGHEITVGDEPSSFGYGQAIWRLPDGGYVAGSEPRADGCAIGY